MKKEKGILEKIEEFLEYLAQNDHNEDKRKEENLKNKFGEENYKKIYSLIGGRKTGALPKKEGNKRSLILYINDEGLKFLEERQKEKKQENLIQSNLILTYALFAAAFLQGIVLIGYNYLDLILRAPEQKIWILKIPNAFIIFSIILLGFVIFSIWKLTKKTINQK